MFHALITEVSDRLQLGGDIDLHARALDVHFEDDDPIRIDHHGDRDLISLTGFIGFYPPRMLQDRLFEHLLQAHIYGLLTDGCVFTVDSEASKILLFKAFSLDSLDAGKMIQALKDFRLILHTWKTAYREGKIVPENVMEKPNSQFHSHYFELFNQQMS